MKNVFIFILFALTITRCLETNINDTLPFEEKAVAFGFLDSVYGARVFVGKNVSIFSKDSSAVKNAHVSLWSDDGLVENLTYFDKSIFLSSPNFKIKQNKNYFFKATTPLPIGSGQVRKDTLFSEKINLPLTVPIEKVRYQYVDQQRTRVNIYVDIKDPKGFNAYVFSIQRFKKDTLLDSNITNDYRFIPNRSQLFSDREFQGTLIAVLRIC